jgi:hypothetical protein
MNKILRNIPFFFLLLAGLVMVAHQTIPHDHHLPVSVFNQDDSCPFSKDKSSHHPVLPVHCHAFNDLASEKATTFFLSDNVRIVSLFFSDYDDVFATDLQQHSYTVLLLSEPVSDSHILEFSQLRAPPLSI